MSERTERLASARLYLCTDGRGGGERLEAFLDDVLEGGVDVVQLREKSMEARHQLELARQFRAACTRHDALFIVNDRVDLAIAAKADGVHLGQDDVPPALARRLLPGGFIVGRSTHSEEDVARSETEPVDYIAAGPVFQTPTKPGRAATGLGLIRHAATTVTRPWFAIGGIGHGNLGTISEAGATRIVVVRALTETPEPAKAARMLHEALEREAP
jgi:thiamine-phosphate pyrophosphorylase